MIHFKLKRIIRNNGNAKVEISVWEGILGEEVLSLTNERVPVFKRTILKETIVIDLANAALSDSELLLSNIKTRIDRPEFLPIQLESIQKYEAA